MSDQTPPPLPQVEELTDAAPPVGPVLGSTGRTGGPAGGAARRRRWVVALVAVGLLLSATAVGALLLTGAQSDSTVASWAPADAVAYLEIRADLPGDQRAALGEFLSAFPGFADQATLDRKLTELYDRLVQAASGGKQTWSADVAPWFDGQLGFAAGPLPAVASLDDPAAVARAGRALSIATVSDGAAALAWVRATAEDAGLAVTPSEAGGVAMLTIGPADHPVVAAASGPVLLIGDEASVRAALARGGSGGLATAGGFQEAVDALDDQQAAIGYLDMTAYADWIVALPKTRGATAVPADLADLLPRWAIGGLRIESDALVGSGAAPRPASAPDIADAKSVLPQRLPATTVLLAETHEAGRALAEGIARGSGADAEALRKRLETTLAPVGGLEGLTGWIGEAGVVVLAQGDVALPGLAAIPDDPTAAANLARSLKNLATLAGLKPTETTYGGATIVTVDLGPLATKGWLDAAPDGSLQGSPRGVTAPTVSWTVTDEIVAVGTDASFVKAILDAPAGDTLAEQSRFSDLVDRAGAQHRALAYADLDAIEALAIAQLEPAERARFETDIRPYLAPLDAFVGVVERDGDLERAHSLVVLDDGH